MTGVDLVDRDPRYVERVDMAPWEREVLRFFEAHVFHLPLPAGAVVELGTARGNNFRRLCEVYGDARCIGYDVANYAGHPHIFERDVRALARTEDRPIALAFNDLSDWTLSPDSKRAGLHYATRNLVVGGLYIDAAFDARGLAWADEHLQDYELVVEDRLIALFRKRAVERAPPPPTERRAIDHGTSPLAASLRVDFRSTPYGAQLVSRARQDDTALDAVVDGLLARPVAPSLIRTTRCGPWRRLEGQTRSVFIDLAGMAPDAAAPGTLVLKGAEPALNDWDALVDWMRQTTFRAPSNYGHRPMSEHFPLAERKVPGAVTMREARREAAATLAFQRSHLAVYGELAPAPIPLALLRHSLDVEARVAKRLRAVLSPASVAIVEDAMADGLAIYVYAYPGFPTRANAYGHLQAGESEAERLSRLNQLDVDATARSWVRLLVRALHLGFLPYTYQNEGLGACFDAGNACVDGGMVDMDSLVPIDDARDDGELYDALVVLRRGVERTLSTLLPHACQFETKGVFVQEYVCELFRCAFDEEQRPGTRLDPRVRDVFQPLSYADLVVRLQSRRRVSEPFFK